MRLRLPSPPSPPLAFAAAALLTMLAADMAPAHLHGPPFTLLFRPASGLALALLLLGGLRLVASVLAGTLLMHALTPALSTAAVAGEALAASVAALLGAWLLQRQARFDLRCNTFRACRQLLVYGGIVGAGAGALTGATALLASQQIGASAWLLTWLHWWMGDALGTLLATPLILAWWSALRTPQHFQRIPEGLLVYGLALVAGQVIFADWRSDLLDPVASGYWMFLFVAWAGVRLGLLGTSGLLCLIALQALRGTGLGTGFFAQDIVASQGFGYWSYMVILSLVGLSLAAYFAERRGQDAHLRIAAIAFECQEGLLITDARQVILQANQAFLKMSGYSASELRGKTPHFLRAPRDGERGACAADSPEPPLRQALQRQEWHRRKSGETYPAWVGITPVLDRRARTTHHVLTVVDITSAREQEELRRQREQAHRDALVREVHHRIKNNLQGIMGMVRGFDRAHPQLHGPVTQLIGQVQSIAVIHGLQGRACVDQVRLCELTSAVAAGLESLWQVPIAVDIPDGWQPCRLHQSEAVPVALVLNELILNSVKHGGQRHQDVQIALRKGAQADVVQISISNPGQWQEKAGAAHVGLDLVAALMPRSGAALSTQQVGRRAMARLELQPPVIQLEPLETA